MPFSLIMRQEEQVFIPACVKHSQVSTQSSHYSVTIFSETHYSFCGPVRQDTNARALRTWVHSPPPSRKAKKIFSLRRVMCIQFNTLWSRCQRRQLLCAQRAQRSEENGAKRDLWAGAFPFTPCSKERKICAQPLHVRIYEACPPFRWEWRGFWRRTKMARKYRKNHIG